MDGNRRWARAHKFKLLKGHDRGAERIETVVEKAFAVGIPYVTFWTFSTENWNRSKVELEMLFTVFRTTLLGSIVTRLLARGVKLQIIGNYKQFPKDIVEGLEKVVEDSKDNTGIIATLAINYGGRVEILEAVKKIIEEEQQPVIPAKAERQTFLPRSTAAGIQSKKNSLITGSPIRSGMTNILDEEVFSKYLSTSNLPDPDLVIRTGGEQRLSGFLPWQTVYSELYFTDTFWPDFDEKEFEKALEEFGNRQRRFGK